MGIFGDSKNSIDDKRYKQILAEEALEEQYFKREHSFKKIDKKVEKKMKEKEEIVEDYVDDTNYDDYSSDYSNFNSIKEDYDEDDIYIEEDELNEVEEDDGYSFDRDSILLLVNSIYKWFAVIAVILAILLIFYLLIKANFIAIFLYIIGLVCAFLIGYILMFVVNTFLFKE